MNGPRHGFAVVSLLALTACGGVFDDDDDDEIPRLSAATPASLSGSCEELAGKLERLLELAGLREVAEAQRPKHDIVATLAEEAARQWTAGFNPRPVTKEDFVKLYEAALE